jgi:hypothetical protein
MYTDDLPVCWTVQYRSLSGAEVAHCIQHQKKRRLVLYYCRNCTRVVCCAYLRLPNSYCTPLMHRFAETAAFVRRVAAMLVKFLSALGTLIKCFYCCAATYQFMRRVAAMLEKEIS